MNSSWELFYTEIQNSVLKKEYTKAEELTIHGLELFPEKVDAVYLLTKTFREESYHSNAWKYYLIGTRINDYSFTHLFLYEKTILNYYIGTPKEESLLDFIYFYNNYMQIGYDNLQHYTYAYPSYEIQPLHFPPIDDFLPTSTSILELNEGYLLNIRYVNYRIQDDSSYLMMENGSLNPYHHLRTRNFTICVSNDFTPISELKEMIPNEAPRHNTHIHGIEDIRLFYNDNVIHFIATSCEYSHNGLIQQIIGTYCLDTYTLQNIRGIPSPKDRDVEKNWIPTGKGTFIYSWHPFVLGSICHSTFQTILSYSTPPFFEHIRGSSTLVLYNGFYYCMVHCIIETRPRKYYHSLIKLDIEFQIQEYTLPLYFKRNHIEYTLGISIKNGTLYSIVSQNDCNPIIVKIYMKDLIWVSIQGQTTLP